MQLHGQFGVPTEEIRVNLGLPSGFTKMFRLHAQTKQGGHHLFPIGATSHQVIHDGPGNKAVVGEVVFHTLCVGLLVPELYRKTVDFHVFTCFG